MIKATSPTSVSHNAIIVTVSPNAGENVAVGHYRDKCANSLVDTIHNYKFIAVTEEPLLSLTAALYRGLGLRTDN
jgi:hypothetical protein